MNKPSDITEAAWAEAAALRSAVIWQSNAANEHIARALMAAEARGRGAEREAIATFVACDCCDVCGESPRYPKCGNVIADEIRKRGEA